MQYFRTISPFVLPVMILIVLFVFILKGDRKKSKNGNISNTFLFMLIMNTMIITFPLAIVFKINTIYIVFMFLFNIIVNYTAFKQLLKSYKKKYN